MVELGKGGEAQGTETNPRLELNPAGKFIQTPRKHSHGEEEKGQEEVEVNDMSASLVLGQRRHTSDFARSSSISQSGRTEVRPLSFLGDGSRRDYAYRAIVPPANT
jgi:hypothetical protein